MIKEIDNALTSEHEHIMIQVIKEFILWIGDNPDREGLKDTPMRFINSTSELFGGYAINPKEFLKKTFEDITDYDEMIILKDTPIFSYCEHHLVPFMGKVHIGYIPNKKIVGISKLARVADAYARRLQIQEKLTLEIASVIQEVLEPKGVGVFIEATHYCVAARGIKKHGSTLVTSKMFGIFKEDPAIRKEFFDALKS